jgi:hypothetical protein
VAFAQHPLPSECRPGTRESDALGIFQAGSAFSAQIKIAWMQRPEIHDHIFRSRQGEVRSKFRIAGHGLEV